MQRGASSLSSTSGSDGRLLARSVLRRSTPFLLLAVVLVACASPEERFAKHLETGARFAEEGNLREAILEYRSALKIEPTSAEVHERLGRLLQEEGSSDAAAYLRDAFRLDPERIDAGIRSARLMLATDIEASSQLLREIRRLAPRSAALHSATSDLQLMRNSSRSAIASARMATQLEPDGWEYWFQLGKAYRARIREVQLRKRKPDAKLLKSAVEAFNKANELAGGNPTILIERALVLGDYEKHSEAEGGFKDAMALAVERKSDHDTLLGVATRATLYAKAKQRQRFLGWALRQMVTIAPDHLGAWSRLAHLEDSLGGDGLRIVEELIEKRPDDVLAHLLYSRYLLSRSLIARAITHLEDLTEHGPESPIVWEQLVRLRVHYGNLAKARKTYGSMLDRYPDDRVTRRTEARIAIAERRYEKASTILRQLDADGDDREVQRLLALSELERENLDSAIAAIREAVPPVGDAAPEVVRLKARIHHDAEEWPQALRAFREMRARGMPLPPPERLMMVRALYGTDRTREADVMLTKILKSRDPPAEAAVEFARRLGSKQTEQAYAYLLDALEENPVHPDVIAELTRMDVARGRREAALARLDHALATGQASARLLLQRARLYYEMHRLADAETDALRAFEANPELLSAADLLLDVYRQQGTLLEAQKSYEEAEAAGILHSGARLLLARLYLHHGELAKGRAVLESLVEAHPEMLEAKSRLARLLAEQGEDLDRALELAEEVQAGVSRDPETADTVGFVYLRKGLNEAAVQQFRYALELASGQPTPVYHYHLGLALHALARNSEAADAFERALELDAGFGDAEDARRQLEATRRPASDGSSPS